MKIFSLTLLFSVLTLNSGFATQEQVAQVSKITGVAPARVAKMAEAIEKRGVSETMVREGKYSQAYEIYKSITVKNGFDLQDENATIYALARAYKIAGRFDLCHKTLLELSRRWQKHTIEDDFREVEAIIEFQKSGNKKPILDFVTWFKDQNKNFFLPKDYSMDRLARVVRVLEMIGDIDQALSLVEQCDDHLSSKKMQKYQSGIINRNREGIKKLKAALLRDKQEGKNIYAQELINTTDYFGFV